MKFIQKLHLFFLKERSLTYLNYETLRRLFQKSAYERNVHRIPDLTYSSETCEESLGFSFFGERAVAENLKEQ